MSNITLTPDLQKTIHERTAALLKESFVSMIPDELLNQMVTRGFDEFMNGPLSYRYHPVQEYMKADNPLNPLGKDGMVTIMKERLKPVKPDGSPYLVERDPQTLPGMVYAMIQKQATEVVKRLLSEQIDHMGTIYGNSGLTMTALAEGAVKQWLSENHKLVAASIIEGMVGNIMRQATNVRY